MLIMSSYTACHWDYHLSNYLFKKYCAEEGRTGLFIYKKVELSDEYFMPFPQDKDPRDLDPRFIVGEDLMINRERFDQDFVLEVYKKVPVSSIGPINAVETSVIRRSDEQLLGKAVSAANGQGWLNKFGVLGGFSGVYCPSGRDENHFPRFRQAHYVLIKERFTRAIQGE